MSDVHAFQLPAFRVLVCEAVRIVGSQSALAEKIGKSQQHISALCTRAEVISAEDAVAIHAATNGSVPASALRPDLWQSPEHVPLSPCGGQDALPAARPALNPPSQAPVEPAAAPETKATA